MISLRQRHGFGLAFWLMTVLALMVRLGGSAPITGLSSDEALDSLAALSILCETSSPSAPYDRHHGRGLTDSGIVLAAASDMQDLFLIRPLLPTGVTQHPLRACFWCFPPVRGPPASARDSNAPRGPPFIA